MSARRRLRIALISPKGPLYRHRGGIFGRSLRYAPLTLTTLAALVPPDLEAEITLYDEGVGDIDTSIDVDIAAMTVITGTARRAYELSAMFRSRGVPVALGGPHVTLAPDDAVPHADSIVTGYAEDTWPRLLRDLAAGAMEERYDQDADLDLSGRPRPRRDLLPAGRYLTKAVFEATRGCTHSCEFCVAPSAWGRGILKKPVEEIIDDIRRQGSKKIIFVDLNLVAERDYAADLFEALIPLGLQWFGLATTRLAADSPLLSLAARSGCRGLLMGLESTSTENLRQMKKGFNVDIDCRRLVETLHRHRIGLQACFVFGLDGDDGDVFVKTARLAVEAGIDLPRFAIATPFPGTPLYRRLEGEGRILTRNWDLYDGQHAVFQPAKMTPEQLESGTGKAWRHAYSAPSMVRRIARSATPLPVAVAANLGYRFYARNLRKYYQCDWPMAASSPRKEVPA